MTLIIGYVVVIGSILVGFSLAGGSPFSLIEAWTEWLVVGGCATGYLIASSPPSVLKTMLHLIIRSFKGSPYSKTMYMDLIHMLYEIFLVGRQQGIIGLEAHVVEPYKSSIIQRYPSFLAQHEAVEFFTGTMKPVIDGKLKADQLRAFLNEQISQKDHHAYQPVMVMTKTADALPGLGIVAAVLGIIITMGAIDGPIVEVGHHVASALVGTFLGVFLSYGIMQPLTTNVEFLNGDELAYYNIMRSGIVSFAEGASPLTAAENMRSQVPEDRRTEGDEMEGILKGSSAAK